MSSRVRRTARGASADDGVKVTVTQGIQVFHDGQTYRDGQSVTVPQTVARRWIRNGWASDSGPSVLRDPRGLASPVVEVEPEAKAGSESQPAKARQPARVRTGTARRDPRVVRSKAKGDNHDE